MSQNTSSGTPMQQLSIGNIVNVSFHLYRTHLKLYFRLSLLAYLWLLVPIYGWAKFFSISGLISRLAFRELAGNPESAKAANTSIKSRIWSFFFKEILLIIFLSVSLFISLLFTAVWISLFNLNSSINYFVLDPFFRKNPWIAVLIMLAILMILLASIFFPTLWLYSRVFITDLPLAIESKTNCFNTFTRTWNLTRKYSFSIQLTLLIAFLVMLPIQILIYLTTSIIWIVVSRISSFILSNSSTSSTLLDLLTIVMIVLGGVIIMPFWQSIKAVIYYNVRLRREGLGLELLCDRKT